MKVVVTGATGHVGRATVRLLGARGHEVVACARGGRPAGSAGGPTPTDLDADASVGTLAALLGPAVALVHLAAWHPPATASTGAEDRRRLVETNVMGTMRALDAARRAHAACVVYASTFEVYGAPRGVPIDEDHPTRPLTDYGATKLAGEDHVVAFAAEAGARAVCLRMPAVYGPGERTARALPLFLRAVARGEAPVVQGDGGDLRDQIHVDDAAIAIALAVERDVAGIFNVSDGEPHAVGDLARLAMRLGGLGGEPRSLPRAKPRRDYHMSIARARETLGFAPRVRIEDGMREELGWIRAAAADRGGP